MGEEVTAGCNFCSFGQRTSEGTLSQFEGRLQLSRFGLPHTWDRTEFFDPALRKSGHIPESIQDIHPDLHR